MDEAKNHKFGSFCFEELEPAKTLEIVATEVIEPHVEAGETVDCSQKSRKRNECNNEVTKNFKEKTKTQVEDSELSEYLQDS